MADDKPKDYELLSNLRKDSLNLVESEVKAARALRAAAAEKIAGDDFLYSLSRLHLGYYSDLMRIVTGQFDAMVEKLRALAPEPKSEPEIAEAHIVAEGARGNAFASAAFAVKNSGGASAPATFDASEFQDRDGKLLFSDVVVEAEATDGNGGVLVPAGKTREFTLRVQAPQAPEGQFDGTVYVRLRGELVKRLRVRLDVHA